MPVCPSCNGVRQVFAFIDYADGHGEQKYIDCSTCKGTGEVTEGYLQDMAIGRKLRDWRVKQPPYESLRDVATRFGLTPVALSHMEHGREPIPEALWEAAGLGEKAE